MIARLSLWQVDYYVSSVRWQLTFATHLVFQELRTFVVEHVDESDRHDPGIDGDDSSDVLIQLVFMKRDTYLSMASYFVGLWMPARSPRVTWVTVLSVSMDAAGCWCTLVFFA